MPSAAPSTFVRDHGLDALRTLAILGMMAAHTARLIRMDSRPAWFDGVLLFEPLIPSLFLLLVGISLAFSRARAEDPRKWYLRQARRAVALWAISTVFFILEHGVRFPDLVTASGILANIAYAILITGSLLIIPKRKLALGIVLIAGCIAYVALDVTGTRIFAVNTANSPFLPLWLFTFAGALWGSHFRVPASGGTSPATSHSRLLKTGNVLGVGAALVAAWIVYRYGLEELFTKPFGRSDAGRTLPAPVTGGEILYLGFYNLRPALALFCLCTQIALLSLSEMLRTMREAVAGRLFVLGRHALGAYILHLALLACLVVIGGPRPLQAPWQGNLSLAVVVVICIIWAFWREKAVFRK